MSVLGRQKIAPAFSALPPSLAVVADIITKEDSLFFAHYITR